MSAAAPNSLNHASTSQNPQTSTSVQTRDNQQHISRKQLEASFTAWQEVQLELRKLQNPERKSGKDSEFKDSKEGKERKDDKGSEWKERSEWTDRKDEKESKEVRDAKTEKETKGGKDSKIISELSQDLRDCLLTSDMEQFMLNILRYPNIEIPHVSLNVSQKNNPSSFVAFYLLKYAYSLFEKMLKLSPNLTKEQQTDLFMFAANLIPGNRGPEFGDNYVALSIREIALFKAFRENIWASHFLLWSEKNAHSRDDRHDSMLHTATYHINNPIMIALLVSAGCKFDSHNQLGSTPLGITQMDLSNYPDYIEPPIMHQVIANQRNKLRALLQGMHDFFAIVATDNTKTAQEFLEAGIPLTARNALGQTALHVAAEQGTSAMVKLLIAHGADLLAVDDNNRTPLDVAAQRKSRSFPAIKAAIRSIVYSIVVRWAKSAVLAYPDLGLEQCKTLHHLLSDRLSVRLLPFDNMESIFTFCEPLTTLATTSAGSTFVRKALGEAFNSETVLRKALEIRKVLGIQPVPLTFAFSSSRPLSLSDISFSIRSTHVSETAGINVAAVGISVAATGHKVAAASRNSDITNAWNTSQASSTSSGTVSASRKSMQISVKNSGGSSAATSASQASATLSASSSSSISSGTVSTSNITLGSNSR